MVATTRPETMLGDVAVAVNPRDDRYARYIGRYLWHPFRAETIPVIGDDSVEPDFGTGMCFLSLVGRLRRRIHHFHCPAPPKRNLIACNAVLNTYGVL